MATNWPNSVQTFTNPSAGDSLNSPSHSAQHTTVNDTVEALQEHAGLVLVKSQTVGSGVSSVTVTDAFSDTFYNYQIVLSSMLGTVSQGVMQFTFVSQSSNFYGNRLSMVNTSSTISNVNTGSGGFGYAEVGTAGTSRQGFSTFNVYAPKISRRKGLVGNYYGSGVSGMFGYENNVTVNYTGFLLTAASGVFNGGQIYVYGYNNG